MDLLSSSPSDKDLPSLEGVTDVLKGCLEKTSGRPVEPNKTDLELNIRTPANSSVHR